MNSSPDTDKIALAFVAAQAALSNPATDAKAVVPTKSGGSFSYKYLSLPALLDHVKPELQAQGLGLMQDPGPDGVWLRITHTSGQFYEFGPLRLPAGNDAQSHGSAITYARRYQLAAALGLAADEDDDGSAASSQPPPQDAAKAGSGRRPATTPPAGHGAATPPEPATTPTGASAGKPDAPGGARPKCPHTAWEPAPRKGFERCVSCGEARKAAA